MKTHQDRESTKCSPSSAPQKEGTIADPLLPCQCDFDNPLCTVRLHLEPGWSKMSCVARLGRVYEHHDPPPLPDGTQGWTPELLVRKAIADGITVLEADGTLIISADAYKLSLDTADAINILGEGMLFTEAECTGAPPASEKHPEQSASGRDRRYAHAYKLWMGVAVASYARQHKRKPKTSSDFRKWADYAWNRYMLRSKGISSLSQGDEAEAQVIRASPLPNTRLPDLPPPTPTPISPGARQASPTGNPRLQPQTPAARCGLSPSAMRTLTSQAARDYAASLGCNIMSHKTNIQPAADVGKLLTMMETEVRALIAPA